MAATIWQACEGRIDRAGWQQGRCASRRYQVAGEGTGKPGQLVEFDDTSKIFNNPSQQATEDYISGRFG